MDDGLWLMALMAYGQWLMDYGLWRMDNGLWTMVENYLPSFFLILLIKPYNGANVLFTISVIVS